MENELISNAPLDVSFWGLVLQFCRCGSKNCNAHFTYSKYMVLVYYY